MIRLRRPRSPLQALRRAAAAGLALAAVVLALRAPEAAAGADDGTATVAVAARDLSPGTVLAAADLRVAAFPAALVPAGTSADPAALTGRTLAAGLRTGEPVTDVRLVGPGLTKLLAPGQVAAPVRPADLAVTDLLRAGDRVDVLATGSDPPRAEVVAAGAVVLAVPRTASAAGSLDVSGHAADGLLLLAVDSETAARLAAASAGETLSVTLGRP